MNSNEAKTQWAPGPWTLDRFGSLVDATGTQVTVSHSGLAMACTNHSSQRIANSRLIAEAPTMAAMLEDIYNHSVYLPGDKREEIADLLQRITQSSTVSEQVKV